MLGRRIIVTEDNFEEVIKMMKRTAYRYKFNNWYKCKWISDSEVISDYPGITFCWYTISKPVKIKNGSRKVKFVRRPSFIMNNTFLEVRKHHLRKDYDKFIDIPENQRTFEQKYDIKNYLLYRPLIWVGTGVFNEITLHEGDRIHILPFNMGYTFITDNLDTEQTKSPTMEFYNTFIRIPFKRINFQSLLNERREEEEKIMMAECNDEISSYEDCGDDEYWGDQID